MPRARVCDAPRQAPPTPLRAEFICVARMLDALRRCAAIAAAATLRFAAADFRADYRDVRARPSVHAPRAPPPSRAAPRRASYALCAARAQSSDARGVTLMRLLRGKSERERALRRSVYAARSR